MTELHDHLREERLLRERPAVAREVAALRTQRARVVGEVAGMARALRLVQVAAATLPLLRWMTGRTRTRSTLSSRLLNLVRRFRR